ncbi:MAG: hypothetical protein JW994_03725, partial [Candidatus Omnitrophica bacterium]|nr:hypothetical protein [Candidatus Omnitrophota bacterium]
MEQSAKSKRLWYFLFFLLIIYLLINTGIVSDDISYTLSAKHRHLAENLIPVRSWFTTPLENYTHVIWYRFFRLDNLVVNNLVKTAYILLCFYFVSKFFSIYLSGLNVLFAPFLFIFFPSHDSTIYWFLGQHLTFSISLYLFAYYKAYHDRVPLALALAFIASFVSYGVVAVAFPLSLVFFLDKKVKKALALFIPSAIYFVFYIFITKVMSGGVDMIPANPDFYAIAKQFTLQVFTFVDAVFGPSMWLKVYYAFCQL